MWPQFGTRTSPCADSVLTIKQLSLAPQALVVLRLVTSTCAGYDDDVQICCEHGGEGGQNVSLTAGEHEQQVTGGGGVGAFHFVVVHSSSLIHSPSSKCFHFSQRQPDEGWRRMERAVSRGL